MLPSLESDEWNNINDILKSNFNIHDYNVWLRKLQPVFLSDTSIVMSVPTYFIKDWITKEYLDGTKKYVDGEFIWLKKGIIQVLKEFYPQLQKVEIIVDKDQQLADIPHDNEEVVESFSKNKNLYSIGTELNEEYTFENYVVGNSNKLAFAIAKDISNGENINNSSNPLFLYGGVGLGKTHLCQAIAWQMKNKFENKNIIYLSAEKFMYLFVKSLQDQDIEAFKERFRNIDVLIIDDIHFLAGKDSTQREFFQMFNRLIDDKKQIVLACDKSPVNLERVDEQLKSRMSGGIVVDITEPDYNLRLDLIEFKSNKMNLKLSKAAKTFLASKLISSGREIESCLKKLSLHSKFISTNIDIPVIEDILADNLNRIQKIISIDQILITVSEFFNVSLLDLKSERRQKNLVIPRHIAMYLSKTLVGKSYPDIAKKFGGKNHATVMHAVKKVEKLIEEDIELSNNLVKIKNILSSN